MYLLSAIWPLCLRCTQMQSDALAQQEAAVAASQSAHQAELDSLLAKQEERLRAWEAECADMEGVLEQKRKELATEEDRYIAVHQLYPVHYSVISQPPRMLACPYTPHGDAVILVAKLGYITTRSVNKQQASLTCCLQAAESGVTVGST